MYFKISLRELEYLAEDRSKILHELRQSSRDKPLKPPILVVPFDYNGLVCIIQADEEEQEEVEPPSTSSAATSSNPLLHAFHDFRKHIRSKLRKLTEPRRPPRIHHVHEGLAVGLGGALVGTTGIVLGGDLLPEVLIESQPFLKDLLPLLSLKCDVCVLSNYKQIFLLADRILNTNMYDVGNIPDVPVNDATNHQRTFSKRRLKRCFSTPA